MAAALKLGATLMKAAVTALTKQSTAGDIAGDLTSVFGEGAMSEREARRARRLMAEIADTAAERVAGAYEHEFRGLSEGQRAVVIDAVADTFARVPATEMALDSDFDATKFEQRVRSLTRENLRSWAFGQDETELYNLILRQSCVEVTGIVLGLSDLANRAVPEVLARLTGLSRDVWEAPRRALNEAAHDEDGAFAERYRSVVDASMDMVKLDSTRLNWVNAYPLSVAYLSLPAKLADGRITTVEEAFAGQRKVLIRASCGCGKTTYLHRLFMLTARRGLTGALAPLNDAMPFYLPLHKYADGRLPQIDDLFADAGRDIIWEEMPSGWIQRQLRSGRGLVLINGVDELPAAVRPDVLGWIKKVADTFDRARFVLTSRPGAVPDEWAAEAGFQVIDLLPMGSDHVVTFIQRWHDAVKSMRPGDAQRLDECAARLIGALASAHALRVLSKNPLTCALMCALHFERQVVLPDQWLDLLNLVIEILVGERDHARGIADSLPMTLSLEQRVFALQDLAYWMITEEVTDASKSDLRMRTGRLLAGMGIAASNGEADSLIEYFTERSGLIHPRPDGALRFESLTWRDYLAAREVISGSHVRFLLGQSHRPDRQHLVVMAAGNAQLASAEELLSGLLSRVDEGETTQEHFRVLVHECLRVVPALGTELRERAEACCNQLMPHTQQEAEILAATGPLAADLLALQPTDELEVTLALIHGAMRIGTADVLPFLARLASDSRSEVREALRGGVSRFDRDEYERMVLTALAEGGARNE
jgi:hypothetical protein